MSACDCTPDTDEGRGCQCATNDFVSYLHRTAPLVRDALSRLARAMNDKGNA